jgi:hypothetical protein
MVKCRPEWVVVVVVVVDGEWEALHHFADLGEDCHGGRVGSGQACALGLLLLKRYELRDHQRAQRFAPACCGTMRDLAVAVCK